MRIVRRFGLGFLMAVVPAFVTAQTPTNDRTNFDDSWYWGIRGGMTSFDAGAGRVSAPSVGGEWLITRTKGALYLAVDQSFFDETSGVFDPSSPGSVRAVNVSDMRRYSMGLLAFPIVMGNLRPYAGLGLSINVIQNAEPLGTYSDTASQNTVFRDVHEMTSRISAVFTGGAMYQIGRAAIFGQASAMPTRSNFLLNGASHTFMFEGGIRYNLSTAIDRLR
jgi:hypothetical protein